MQPDASNDSSQLRRAAALARFATIGLIIAMFVGTHVPNPVAVEITTSDKTIHFWAYLALSFSLLTSWELSSGRLQPIHFFLVWLACTVYGAIDEITQIPVGRTCDGVDWLFDVLGIVAGLSLFRILRPLIYRVAVLIPVAQRINE
ncbi:MAG: VanZ family protein [Bythopirellula sp.]|nr:VanZ family protein [Bythopirellula sp.]